MCVRRLVGFASVLGPLQLDFKTLHPDLEAVHGVNSRLGRDGVVVAHKPCKYVTSQLAL